MTAAQLYAAVAGRIPDDPPRLSGFDEIVYHAQADTLRREGIGAYRRLARRYVACADLQLFPSPLRWLWLLLVATFARISPRALPLASCLLAPLAAAWAFAGIAPWWLAALLCAASPLLRIVGRSALQDGPVAAVTLVAVGFGLRGDAVGLAVAIAALLSIKDAAVFSLPAVAAACLYAAPMALWGVAIGIAAWLAMLCLLFGPVLTWRVMRASRGGHDNPYARAHQRGAPHRLVTDLLLLSPLPLLAVAAAPSGTVASAGAVVVALLVGAHAVAPVRNVRFIVAADLAVRCLAAAVVATVSPLLVLPMIAMDLYVIRKTARVYDPVTAELCVALGMPARPEV